MRNMTRFWRLYLKFRFLFIPDGPDGDYARANLYRPFLKKCGRNLRVYTNAFIYDPNSLTVGDFVCLGFGSYIGSGHDIHLDDASTIGPYAVVSGSSRVRKDGGYRTGGIVHDPVYIGKGTQVAAHAIITAGVSLGNGCLVAAGAVVTGSFGDNALVGGVPARLIKEFVDEEPPRYTY